MSVVVTWQRWREPLAITLFAALAGLLAVRVVGLALAGSAGPMGFSGPDDMLLIAAVLTGIWCTKSPASPHARQIVTAGCVLVGLTIASWIVIGAIGLGQLSGWAGGDPSADPSGSYGASDLGRVLLALGLAEGLLRLVLPVASLVALVIAQRRLAAAASDGYAAVGDDWGSDGSGESPAGDGGSVGDGDLPDSDRLSRNPSASGGSELRTSPTAASWQPSDAAGAVWLTADAAAQGEPASTPGTSASTRGTSASSWGVESWDPPASDRPEVLRGGISHGEPGRLRSDVDSGGVSYADWGSSGSDVGRGGVSYGEAADVDRGGVSYGEAAPGVSEVDRGGVSHELPRVTDDDDDDLR